MRMHGGLRKVARPWGVEAWTAATCAVFLLCFTTSSRAGERQELRHHVPAAVAHLKPVGRLSASTRLDLAIGLPLRNQEALTNLLQQIYDPMSPEYHHYLAPGQFVEMFGPTEQDYQAVIAFAKLNGLTVTGTHPNRMLVDMSGSVADIERTFHVTMRIYSHPAEPRTFYAPDVEPSLDLSTPVLTISGLNNYIVPHPMSLKANTLGEAVAYATGSGPIPTRG